MMKHKKKEEKRMKGRRGSECPARISGNNLDATLQ
jgi:hypothetical protein